MSYATPADVAALLSVDEADLPTGTQRLLDLATGLLATRFPKLQSAASVPEEATIVCAEVVARPIRNPDGVQTEQAGNMSETFAAPDAGGILYLTEDDLETLAGAWGPGRAMSIRVTSPYARP